LIFLCRAGKNFARQSISIDDYARYRSSFKEEIRKAADLKFGLTIANVLTIW